MFNLEQSIADWRKQMLAAGIKTPAPLEELECHLCEEIERQMKSGINGEQAFEIAVQQIGAAEPLKTEFRNAGFTSWRGQDKSTRINRALALLWLANCSWGFFSIATGFLLMIWDSFCLNSRFGINPAFFLALLFEMIFLRGMVASIRVFGGNDKEIRTIRFTAVLYLVADVGSIVMPMISMALLSHVRNVHLTHVMIASPLEITIIAINPASVFLLRSPPQRITATKW